MSVKFTEGNAVFITANLSDANADIEKSVINYQFTDNQNNSFNHVTGFDTNPCLGMEGSILINKDPKGEYILVSSSKDKFDQISHGFLKVDKEGKIADQDNPLNQMIFIGTNYDPSWFKIAERYSISVDLRYV